MQRLAQLNPADRGALVRVVPPDESTTYLAAVPEPLPEPVQPEIDAPTDPPLAEDVVVAGQETPDVIIDPGPITGNVIVDVTPSPRPLPRVPDRRTVPTVRSTGSPRLTGGSHFSPPVITPVIRAAPIGGGGPSVMRAGLGGTLGRASSPGVARIPAPRPHVGGGHSGGGHSGGGHSGGGISGGDAFAVVLAAVVVVGLIALVAEAASEEEPPFDGWARIAPDQPLHLRYANSVERTVKLRDLRPADLVGLRDTVVKDEDGRVTRLPADADQRVARSQPPQYAQRPGGAH